MPARGEVCYTGMSGQLITALGLVRSKAGDAAKANNKMIIERCEMDVDIPSSVPSHIGQYPIDDHSTSSFFSHNYISSHGNRGCTVKVVHSHMRKTVRTELALIQDLSASSKRAGTPRFVELLDHFECDGTDCMVFEGRPVGLLDIADIRRCAAQMFEALLLLKQAGIIHADIRPENVHLGDGQRFELTGFTAAIRREDVYVCQHICDPCYRPPEVTQLHAYDHSLDMWSLGCTLFELYTGGKLMTGEMDQMVAVLAPGVLLQLLTSMRPGPSDLPEFADFLLSCLSWDKDKRISPDTDHPFFRNNI